MAAEWPLTWTRRRGAACDTDQMLRPEVGWFAKFSAASDACPKTMGIPMRNSA